ncbi:MAG: flavodoxin family protein [Sedimentisphaerales bacterium]|nr:flavodoxin family protein [Sedimentisphaerales bacterium]
MKALVIYESFYGNTEKIAQAIGDVIGKATEVKVLKVDEVKPEQLKGLNLLVVGSPTRAFSPSPGTKGFLKRIPTDGLRGVRAAAFDTRISEDDAKPRALRFLMKTFGYAAEPVSKKLGKKGAEIILAPEGFCVNDTKGPLKEGELERATAWAKQIVEKL